MVNAEEHLGLARMVAFKYTKFLAGKYTYDELLSFAYEGLIKAANRFDESKGCKFSTFAVPWIKGSISKALRDDKWHFQRRGVPVLISSLNAIVDDEEKVQFEDLINGGEWEDKLSNNLLIETLIDQLEEKEKEIIYLRYFEDLTQVQVSKKLKLSQVQVSRSERKILQKMRCKCGTDIGYCR